MQEFINFIVDNWQWFSSIAVSIVSFILLLIFKRRPKVFGYYLDICKAISRAESIFIGQGRGAEKLDYVIKDVCSRHELDPKLWSDVISTAVDRLMSLPNKKGGK